MEQQQQGWGFQTPGSMYTTNQYSSPFAANISSYFRRPAKIVKSASRNSSPKHLGRRKTTTTVPVSRTRSVLDKQRSNLPHQSVSGQQTRPLSWHPNSEPDFNFSSQQYLQNTTYQNYFQPLNLYGTTSANGLVTPMSYAVTDEPQIQELITPLEELSAQEGMQGYDAGFYHYQNWVQSDMSKDHHAYTMDNMFPQNAPEQIWQWNNQTSVLDIPTAPSSPTFLPIQGGIEASPLTLDTRPLPAKECDGEELVGMGLYDSPADVRSSSMLFGGGFGGPPKRSLKLEESFEPVPESNTTVDNDDDGEEDEGGAQNDEEDDNAELEQQEESNPALHFPIYQDPGPLQTSMLAGQSFFFDSEHEVPSATTSNADMNYTATTNAYYQPQYATYGWI